MLLEIRGETTPENEEMEPKQNQYPAVDVTEMIQARFDAVKSNIA